MVRQVFGVDSDTSSLEACVYASAPERRLVRRSAQPLQQLINLDHLLLYKQATFQISFYIILSLNFTSIRFWTP